MRVRVRKLRLAADRPSFGQALGALPCAAAIGFASMAAAHGAPGQRVVQQALSLRESLDVSASL
ncbi:hypothetical protein [Paenibacillus riograndensis]|uniref:hypothetical protein n=1 Tax=Paenibacillus riograndensis TaxID=483937 RepID=UPI00145EA2E8|nr:hypothetical protein [Paenibacillus riograndensis]